MRWRQFRVRALQQQCQLRYETLDEIRRTARRVIVETIRGEDVTEEFIDLEARLKTKKALEQQFLEIMKQSRSVEDALSVQTELVKVRGEIERIEGRRRFLENRSSLSTIKIRLQTPVALAAESSGLAYDLGHAFSRGFEYARSFVLGLVTFIVAVLPFFLLVVLPAYFVVRYFWKKKIREKPVSVIVKEELEGS